MPKVRKEIPELEKLVQVRRKKFVRYEEGAQLYSIYQKYAVEKGEGIMRIAVTYENGQIFSTLDTQRHLRSMM